MMIKLNTFKTILYRTSYSFKRKKRIYSSNLFELDFIKMGKGGKGGNKGGKGDKGGSKEPAAATVPKGGGSKVKVRHIRIV